MHNIKETNQIFSPIEIPPVGKNNKKYDYISLILLFSETVLYRVFDEFQYKDITIQKDGSAVVKVKLPDQDWLIRYLLSFGGHVQIISPDSMRRRMLREIEEMYTVLSNGIELSEK